MPTAQKRQRTASKYEDIFYVPPTSNVVERLFSQAKFVLTDLRKSMSDDLFESVIVLKINRKLWDAQLVNEVLDIEK